MNSFQGIDSVIYSILYVLFSMLLLYKSKIRLSVPAFLFFAFFTLEMGLGPVIEVIFGRSFPNLVNPYIDILLPYGMFICGYYLAKFIKVNKKRYAHKHSLMTGEINEKVLWGAYFICMIAGVVYLLKTGLNPLSDNFDNERIESQKGMGGFTYLNGALVLILPLLFEGVRNGKVKKEAFVVALLFSLFVFMLRGSRSLCMTPLFLICMTYDVRNRIRPAIIGGVGLFCLVAVVGMGMFRSGNGSSMFNSFINLTCNHIENLNRVYGLFHNNDNFPHCFTFLFNFNLLLPGEGLDYTIWLKEMVGATFSGGGMTPSLIGDLYINLGYAGVYLGMLLFGIVACVIEAASQRSKANQVFLLYLGWVCCGPIVGGGISNSTLTITLNLVMYLFLKLISSQSFNIKGK